MTAKLFDFQTSAAWGIYLFYFTVLGFIFMHLFKIYYRINIMKIILFILMFMYLLHTHTHTHTNVCKMTKCK